MFDFFSFLAAGPPERVQASVLRAGDAAVRDEDNITATVTHADGSVLTLLYSTAGPAGYPKEQIEVFAPGLAAVLTDFRELRWTGAASGEKKLRAEDKGQAAEMTAWARYLAGDPAEVVGFEEAARSTRVTLLAREAARTGTTLRIAG
jgi:predicted dehydrogenase